MKAAPRFELGIKDLQSSALPLGHAALKEVEATSADRISSSTGNVLVLCNGHGEDLIALRVLEALHDLRPEFGFDVLPLVGEGKVFDFAIEQGWLRKLGPSRRLPSGGFSNQSLKAFVADISGGLVQNTFKQWSLVREAALSRRPILAIGDLFPLVLAWSSGASFGFIGTPKSDYTWRSGPGFSISDYYHCLKGSEWDLWECFLMRSRRCRLVAVRDHLTARGLRRHGIPAQALGNPMMDGLQKEECPQLLGSFRRLLLLCGSRMPEAGENFKNLLGAIECLDSQIPLIVLVALGSEPDIGQIEAFLETFGFISNPFAFSETGAASSWRKDSHFVLIGPGQFTSWARWAEVGVANAGTATEQLVGLGIPALSLPGEGPQFTRAFALRQSRLLGGAVITCQSAEQLTQRLKVLFANQNLCDHLGLIGSRRMGKEGASSLLAELVLELLLEDLHDYPDLAHAKTDT